ncbi:hypothetical protein ACFLRZ_04550 [Bacteroidota bacterium]
MKRIIFTLILLISMNTYAQKFLKMAILGGAIYDYSLSEIYGFKGSYVSLNTYYPFKAGFQVAYSFNNHLSAMSGYHFQYRYLEVNMYTSNVGNIFDGTKIMTSEIPLFLKYTRNINSGDHFSILGELGISIDMMFISANTFGRYKNDIIGTLAITDGFTYTIELPDVTFPSLHASLGFSTKLGETGAIDVLVNYHMQFKEQVKHLLIDYFTDYIQDPIIESYENQSRISYFGIELRYYLPWKINLSKK